jgi:predicted O-linked N-acetylglucosamine transferase (SPINDLY family)
MNVSTAPLLSLLSMAQSHLQGGRLREAEQAYREALVQAPTDATALHGLGAVLLQQQHGECDRLRATVVASPNDAEAHVELAQSLRRLGHNDQAAEHFARAVALVPNNRSYQLLLLLHRGTALDAEGRSADALACFHQAVVEHPDSVDAWAALGVVQSFLRSPAEAAASLQRALQLDSTRIDLIARFGRVLQELERLEDAALVFERLLHMDPNNPMAAGRLMHCKMLMADWTALDRLQGAVETGIRSGLPFEELFGLQGYCADPELLHRAATAHNAASHPDRSSILARPHIGRGPKIRIGYLAGEFRNQATSILLTEVLERHDPSQFEVHAFDNGWSDNSALRKRIESAVRIVPIRGQSDWQAAQQVRDREIDVLINLNGYFGLQRTNIFSLRPAPLQVNYLGFPGTLGAPYIDYLIADQTVIPPDSRAHYTEQIVHLPDCYQPNDSTRQVADQPSRREELGLPAEAFLFCCVNNAYKIMPAVFDVWMRLLQQVPGSMLVLLSAVPEAQANLRHEAMARGVEPGRLHFVQNWRHENHLARLRLMDLFLDTLPYNAHTTGSDALWAGLPVVTCMGQTFPSRVGASLLNAVGLPELVTRSLGDYEALALLLARDPAALAAVRSRLNAALPTCALYATERYTRHLEAALSQMVERARSGLPPASFTVARLP